ncbi:hypothetical protein OIE62_07640 [Streptomyces scopuliridis]|uniref:Uncharacterized protein n=1 Tax=Streptomyces scopuliridis TaxID=452529 RepID=A0ACD4ZU55_9ACTN|nr:hypothetical protein [Streptomyces scopuliridis]WSC01562.1 hypothetical protein OG835_34180 [Streptomyces scopuliridis]WSC04900.1 hypothetical protein OIE62_07640 [Streptomyces scopuliridis]
MSPARHHRAWRLLLDDLDHAASQIERILTSPVESGTEAARERDIALWPYLTAWAEHGYITGDLADQHRLPAAPSPSADKQREWTVRAQDARRRGDLEPFESWYDAEGRLITLAYLIEDDASTVLALAGDLDSPRWQVLGQYDNEYAAGQASPPPVPPGVLRPDSSRYHPRVPTAEVTLQERIGDVVEARHSGDVADVLLTVTQDAGYAPGPLARMGELISTAAEFAEALETRQGHRTATRLRVIARQLALLNGELHEAGEELSAAVGVLPPHRAPRPRFLTTPAPPALTTTPPLTGPAPYGRTATARRR